MTDKAKAQMTDTLYFASMMVKTGKADGEVAGAENTTGNVLRPALQIIRTSPGISAVSGSFIIVPTANTVLMEFLYLLTVQ